MKDNLELQTLSIDSLPQGATNKDAQGVSSAPQLRAADIVDSYEFLVNGEILSVKADFADGSLYDAVTLTVEKLNSFEWLGGDTTTAITVNGIALENGRCEFALEEINENAKIIVQVTSDDVTREFAINTLNTHLPPIAVEGTSKTPGDIFLSFINTRSIVKMDNDGKILYYRNEDSPDTQFGLWDFKAHQIDGKTYYSYHSTYSHPENTFFFTGHNPGQRVILDENYQEVARLTAIATEKNQGDTALDGHEFLMLGEDHYIVMSYLQVEVDNIPDTNIYTGETIEHADKVWLIAPYIQEIDHGEVTFEWLGTEHPELYCMTVTEQSSTAADFTNTDPEVYIDYAHLNAITIDDDGNLVVSCRHLNSMLKLDRVGGTGNILWVLSGFGDDFGLEENQKTSGQHFVRYHGNGIFSAFNNNNKEKHTNLVMYHLNEDETALDATDGFQRWVVPGTMEIAESDVVAPHDSIACGAFQQFGEYGVASWGWNVSGDELFTEFLLDDASQITFQVTSDYIPDGAYATYRGVKCLSAAPELEFTQEAASWSEIKASSGYVLSIGTQDSGESLCVGFLGTACDLYNLPDGEYAATVTENDFGVASATSTLTVSGNQSPMEVVSTANGAGDLFFVKSTGVWSTKYRAKNVGSINDWSGTKEIVNLGGKNQLGDIFLGSSDDNLLLLTDDTNGDALFVDDIYGAAPGELGTKQSRLAQIREIRAGLGDDIVDLTSQRFEYNGGGVVVRGGMGDDVIWANKGDNWLFGDAGNDRIVGAAGNDVLVGGAGNDKMHGGGGNDIFAFGGDWGQDIVEQLAGSKVTLWFAEDSKGIWDNSTLTYTDGDKSVKVTGVGLQDITLRFGNEDAKYDDLLSAGAFSEFTSEKIFEDRNRGMLA